MDDIIQDNIEYIFDYQAKLSYDLPLNTIQFYEIDLSSSVLNNKSPIESINNVQDTLNQGFRKLFVNITWDSHENNWIICQTNPIESNDNNNIYNEEEKQFNNYNDTLTTNDQKKYSITNLIKSIRKWIDNTNDCNVVILIFKVTPFENIDKERTISCMNGYLEKLEILKRDIMSEINDILYTVDMMKNGEYNGNKYNKRILNGNSSNIYTNGNWTTIKKLCYINKKILIGLDSNILLCKQYKDNIIFTNNRSLFKKLVTYQDLKKYILFSSNKTSRTDRIDKIIKLVDKRNNNIDTVEKDVKDINNEDYDEEDENDIDIKDISVVFSHEDIINLKQEVVDFINNNNVNIHLKSFDIQEIQTLKKSLLWSWDINTNFIEDSSNTCIVINKNTRRWNYHSCDDNIPIACKNNNNPLIWKINTDDNKCDNGYILSIPHSSEENGMLLKTLYNKTLASYDNFFLTKTPIEINDGMKSDKRESSMFKINNFKYMIGPSSLEYSELIEEIYNTSFPSALMCILIIVFFFIRSIFKQYSTFKKRRRPMDIKKRLKIIETQTVPI
ncbi:hypothetical protein BCR32DRAFT_268079 [Anaeromyces robustus]|uniref:C-type lectin domain-containing protein n=1 Tax=Anaeromyces robustus TaxID=1754192 RepID=A0A1Y1X7Q2_9FUNG|nr:hypothetical protein BCR32DRAFT_268079 [Anaeromyces robustus]|eukprot:ORX81782.1 hypothetical protein BCR32DRAFT_268079 [Anaeromyces robustus]